MNEEKDFFRTCFNTVIGLEVKNESQAIAKEVILKEVKNLQEENKKQKEVIDKAIEYILECSINEKGHINVSLSSEEVVKLLDILEECYNE